MVGITMLSSNKCVSWYFAEEAIKSAFNTYGTIQEIRVFKEKGYAFIRWAIVGSRNIANTMYLKCTFSL